MDEQVYQVTGYQYGNFKANDGSNVKYCNLFCISPITGEETVDFHFAGHKAYVFKCASSDVLKDVNVQDKVKLFFNQYQKVCLIQPVTK